MAKFILIDGTALVFRGFYAIPSLKTSAGLQVNAIFGFYTILLNLLLSENPTHIAVCFDRHETTTRKQEFDAYKATRTKAPDELYAQIEPIKEILTTGGFNLVEKPAIEADDLIATLAKTHEANDNLDVLVYSSDLDLLQLVDKVRVLKPGSAKTGNIIMDTEAVIDKYGFSPNFIPDFKGLHGDPSDNLPGVKGVGKVTASKLIQTYGHLEQIYENISEITGALKEKLLTDKEVAFLCKKLATLHTDIDIETGLKNFEITNINFGKSRDLFSKFEMKKLAEKIERLEGKIETVKHLEQQQSLF